jgi:hypothetical protein
METSDSYVVVEKMIRLGEITTAELRDLLDTLEREQLISAEEHATLLEMAEGLLEKRV